ncbi:MAG: hypothetical protein R3F59_27385 [Myxococcota bacterium]
MRILAVVGLAGCGAAPLGEVEIEGGSLALQAQLRAELVAFDQDVGPGRIDLRAVHVTNAVNGGHAGQLRSNEVWIDVHSGPVRVLRHELCHRVSSPDDLAQVPLWEEVAAQLFGSDLAHAIDVYPTAHAQREEAMAQFCEAGPVALSALRDLCPGEDPLAAELADWLMRTIYQNYEAPPLLALDPAEAVTFDGWVTIDSTVAGTTADGLVVVGLDGAWRAASLQTGQRVDADGLRPAPDPDEAPTLRGVERRSGVGLPGGPAAAVGTVDLNHFGASARRLFAYDPAVGAWTTVPQCLDASAQLFSADGGVWTAWREGEVQRWQPVLR